MDGPPIADCWVDAPNYNENYETLYKDAGTYDENNVFVYDPEKVDSANVYSKIYLRDSCYWVGETATDATIVLSGGGLSITKSVSINGKTSPKTSGGADAPNLRIHGLSSAGRVSANSFRLVTVNDGCSFSASGVSFGYGYADNGSAVYVKGGADAKFECCHFSANTATKNGGEFDYNKTSSFYGGAINANDSSEISIDGTQFIGNHANSGAGTIFVGKNSTLTIQDSYCEKNWSSNGTGCIDVNENSTLTIQDSQFIENYTGNGNGGVININSGGAATIKGSTFDGNWTYNGNGGAISIRANAADGVVKTVVNVENTDFKNNYANNGEGGAICLGDFSNGTRDELSITGGVFEGNHTNNGDAGVLYVAVGAKADIANACFTQNIAGVTGYGNGGAIYINGTLDIESSQFDQNSARKSVTYIETEGTQFNGGAVFNNGVVSITGDSSFTDNEARLGGAVYNAAGAELTITGPSADQPVSFANCRSYSISNGKYGSGGAIYNSSTAEANGVAELTNVSLTECGADKYGGAISNYGVVGLADCSFTDNEAGSGGAIQNAGSLTVDSGVFTANNASYNEAGQYGNGGAIYTSGNASTNAVGSLALLGACVFDGNAASNAGGAIDVVSGDFAVGADGSPSPSVTFENNEAGNIGGAIALGVGTADLNGEFTFNDNASQYGNNVAANVKVTDAKELVEGFGFQYSSVSNNDFASFIKIGSSEEIGGKLSFEYLCSLIDADVSEIRSLTVSCGVVEPITLIPGRSVEYDDLGIVADGVYKVNVCFDNGTTYSLLINVVNNRSFTVRKTPLLNASDTVSFSFTLYNAAASQWTINWGDGSEAGVFNKLSSTLTASHIYETEGEYRIVVQAVVGEENVEFVFVYNVVSESINFDDETGDETGDDNAAALLDEIFASDDLFDEYFV